MPRKAPAVIIRELLLPKEASLLFPFIRQLNPAITKTAFNQSLKEMLPLGYRCIIALDGKNPIGACGIWTANRFWCGRFMEVDNVVVDQKARSGGIGKHMMDWVEKEAKRTNCKLVIADSYTHNVASHRFYSREKYIIKGFCFVKEL
jgi:GNAT superfamily N-acetyltransferase